MKVFESRGFWNNLWLSVSKYPALTNGIVFRIDKGVIRFLCDSWYLP